MKIIFTYIIASICCLFPLAGQTLNDAKELYKKGQYDKALALFRTEYSAKPADALVNQYYGTCLLKTRLDLKNAEDRLLFASKKNIREAFLSLGELYTVQYRFDEATAAYKKYESLLQKTEVNAKAALEKERKKLSQLHRLVANTEDIQIIDSLVLNKTDFLSAYRLSQSSGKLNYFNTIFKTNNPVESTVYSNEKDTKLYFSQPNKANALSLFSMDKLIDGYGNEKSLSANNFGLIGDLNYPYVMPDGLTIYFAAKDTESIGGYDLFVSRYNTNNDSYLVPERLSMPFNSEANDYMLVVDEEKGIGWFASDRSQAPNKVCIYTFIPNQSVKIIENGSERYLANRARITSIKDSWIKGKKYTDLIALAGKESTVTNETVSHDFTFVINDVYTYFSLNDFKNKSARNTFLSVLKLKSELNTLTETLANDREQYANASPNEKRRMNTSILMKEERLEDLLYDIPALEMQARNMEILSFKKNK